MRIAHHYHHPLLFEAIIVMQQLISINIIKTDTVTGRWCNTILLSHINHMMYESIVCNILLVDKNYSFVVYINSFVIIDPIDCVSKYDKHYEFLKQYVSIHLTRSTKFNALLYIMNSPAIEFSLLYLQNYLFQN